MEKIKLQLSRCFSISQHHMSWWICKNIHLNLELDLALLGVILHLVFFIRFHKENIRG